MAFLSFMDKEKSLLLVKPQLVDKFNEITGDLDTGSATFDHRFYLKVLKSKQLYLGYSTACDFFKGFSSAEGVEPSELPAAFDAMIAEVTSGPSVIAVIENLDGSTVSKLKEAMPALKEKYGDGFHCSNSAWEALREVDFFFPYVDRLPVTTTLVVAANAEKAAAVKSAILAKDMLIVAEGVPADGTGTFFPPLAQLAGEFDPPSSTAMLVEGAGAVEKCALLLGPAGAGEALSVAPGTLRVGESETAYNGLYSSPMGDLDQSKAETELLAPMLKYQQSLIIVKPDAMSKLEEIVSRIEDANFTILDKITLELSEARAHNFFEAHKNELSFSSMVRHMCSGPVCAIVVARMSAISVLKQLAGPATPKEAKAFQPTSLRGMYARDIQRNAVHVSESEKTARSEIAFFFPNILQNPLPDADETQDFLLRKSVAAKAGLQEVLPGTGFDIEPSLLQFVSKGLVSLCQTRPHGELNNLQALEYLSTWLVQNNPNKPVVVEPEVEIPVAMVSEGAAYTVEEPEEEMPTVVEVNVAADKGDKYMVEFEAPPLVVMYMGDVKTAAEVAEAVDYKHLDLETILKEEGEAGNGQIGKEIQRKLAGGEPPLSLEMKLKLPVLRSTMFSLGIGRYLITGLSSQNELLQFEQEVAEITILLAADKELEQTPAVQYYAAFGKVRSLDAEDKIEPAKKLLLPKVMYFLAPTPDSDSAVCEKIEAEYGYCHINVPALLKKLSLEDTAVGKTTKAALDAGEYVHEKIVGPEIVEQMNGARRFGFTSFVLCGFPQTVEQLRFFESQVKCDSEAIFMDYPRPEIMDAAIASNTSLPQDIVEKTVNLYYSAAKSGVKAALTAGPCAKVQSIPATTTVPDVSQLVFAGIRPSLTIILGPPIASEVKEFAVLYANTMGAVHVDVDALLDAELERKTEVGVEMSNMLARGQVVPLRMVLEVIKSAAKWTSTDHLVLTSFPRYLDEADSLLKHFTVKKVILAEAGEGKAAQIYSESGLGPDVFKDMMNRVLSVATFFAAQGLMQRVELSSDPNAVPKMLADCTFSNRPKCIALVGLPFVGTTEVAEALKPYGFACVGKEVVDAVGPVLDEADPEKKLEKAKDTVKKIEEAMDSATAPCLAIDDLLTDNETYAAYVEALGGPPVNVIYLTCSDEALEAKKANVVKDDGDAAEIANARVEAVKATLDMGGGEDGVAKGADHYLNKPVLMPWTPEYFKKVKDVEALEASETPGHPSKEFLKAQAEVKEAHFPIVQKVNIPDKQEGETDATVMAGVMKTVAKLVQPTVHCVLAPQSRGVGVTIASVLAASAAGRQVVLDAMELATPNPRYSAAVNTALKTAAALGEPILPDIWAEIFAERLKEYSLQHVFLANYPGDSVRTYPTVRDELDVLAQFASVKGLITANFTQRAMHKYCFKGSVESPETATEAFAYYRGTPVTDVERYSSMLAAKTSYLKEVDMEREKWVTELEIDATDDALPQAAREGALAVLDLLQMLP
jgi:nucleoside-diphosphate kinase